MQQFEVLIIGGGMVGASVALGLAQQGFQVGLVEKQLPDLTWSEDAPWQARVSALTRASENLLKNLGAWQGIERRRLQAFTSMHVLEQASTAQVTFQAQQIAEPNLGHVVENSVIQAALWDQLVKHPQISIMENERLMRLETQPYGVCEFDSGLRLQADLIVGADGAFSQVRQLAGIGLDTHDYAQACVVGCVTTEQSHQNACWQKYTEQGPFAYLAMPDNVSSIAWYMPVNQMEAVLNLADEEFRQAVTHASQGLLGEVTQVWQRSAFPLVRRHAQTYIQPHLVLVGDAAHTIHPQAGQGVNLGLLDAAVLIEVLTQARQQSPQTWSRRAVLRRYERWRRGDNALVQRSMEVFDRGFASQQGLPATLRAGMLGVGNQLSWVKNQLMEQALQGRGEKPRLTEFGTVL